MRYQRLLRCLYPFARGLSSLPDHKQIIMPKVSPTMTAGRLIVWKKNEGEPFHEGEDIADVESDKATMPISAREDGYIARIFVPPDTPDIPLGQLLAITVEEEEDIAAFKDYRPPSSHSASADPSPADPAITGKSPSAPSKALASESDKFTGPLGPAVMRILRTFPNINLHAITPSGPKGRLLKGDVLAAIEDGSAFSDLSVSKPLLNSGTAADPILADKSVTSVKQAQVHAQTVSESYTDIPVSSMRRAIAKRLLQSKTMVPHRYTSARYHLDELLALRQRLNYIDPSPRISVNDFVIRAVGIALRRVPEMNVYWDDLGGNSVPNDRIDISMAVAIPGGLITPIVTDVDRRGLVEIAGITKDLVTRAKEGTLAPEEFKGGCFSISNLGMYGISSFSAIINPPQSGILAVGSGIKRAVFADDGTIRTVTEGMATISTDARAIDDETASRFLKELTDCLSNPEKMIA